MRTAEGYTIDAVVSWRGVRVNVEVDGPTHFAGRAPTAATLLKRRQLRHFGSEPLLIVPHFEWEGLASRDAAATLHRRQAYLRRSLDELIGGHGGAGRAL